MSKEDAKADAKAIAYVKKSKLSVLHKYAAIIIVLFSFSLFFSNYIDKITACVNSLVIKCNNKLSDILISWGLRVDTVSLKGNYFVGKEEVLRLIDKSRSILLISLPEIKRSIELLSGWIKNVEVQRVLPNTIVVSIEEYKPFAIWHHGNQFSIIDSTGHVIINDYHIDGLILIFGNEALSELAFIKGVINNNTELSNHIRSFNHEQGWNIIFNNGLEVKLPQENPNKAWNCLIKLHNNLDIIKNNWKAIDLRTQDKIFIKKQRIYHQSQLVSCN